MINKIFLLFAVFLISCQPRPKSVGSKPEIDPGRLISCDGVGEVSINYSYADLERNFGAQSITEHENTLYGKYYTLWEGQDKQLNVYWKEKSQPYKNINYLEVNSGPHYVTTDGLKVGISMRDMVKINGNMPLTFNNFEAERDNGLIISFNNGNIAKSNPCIKGTLEVISERNINVNELGKFKLKNVVESYDKLLERMDVALQSIRVYPVKVN
jgi:hypothetical protein